MGSQKVKSSVVFDTGSGWLTVTTKDCKTCTYPRYDPYLSSYSKLLSDDMKTLSVSVLVFNYLSMVLLPCTAKLWRIIPA